jgi:UPF0716 protein FxsA
MGKILFLVFLGVPLIEIGLCIAIGQWIGIVPTLAGVVVTALLGSWIIRMQGLSLIAEIQKLMAAGALPAAQMAEGLMLAVAGALLLTPGYFTDTIGFLLFVPAVRRAVFSFLRARVTLASFSDFAPEDPEAVDLDTGSWRPPRR